MRDLLKEAAKTVGRQSRRSREIAEGERLIVCVVDELKGLLELYAPHTPHHISATEIAAEIFFRKTI